MAIYRRVREKARLVLGKICADRPLCNVTASRALTLHNLNVTDLKAVEWLRLIRQFVARC
jgi:hypothetical protein